MRIILLFPKWTFECGIASCFTKRASTWPPLSLAYLAAIAEKEGHEVKIIDGEVENIPLPEMIKQTATFSPDIIGITGATPFYHIAVDLANGLKEANNKIPIVIGGPHITVLREEAFNPCFDYGFIGEADGSFSKFLERYEAGEEISDIKGILFRHNGVVKFTGAAEPIEDLDSIPFPARHLLKMGKYKMGTQQGLKNYTSIMFSRGCPFSCIFCSTKVFGKRVRKRSVRSVIDEIISVVSNFNIRHFTFTDDNLTLDRNFILELCDLLEKEKLVVTFEGSTRADLVDEELVCKMANAGLTRLSFGLETVDPEIRKIIKKDVPLESYGIANRLVDKYGIECLNSIMIGLPGETRETINKTLSYLRHSHEIKQANCSIAMPYPGTELFEMARSGNNGMKLITEDFSKFKRYGSAVMTVGDLSPNDLVGLQNHAFISIYSAPWRWIPTLKRGGFDGIFVTSCLLIVSIIRVMFNKVKQVKGVR